MAGVTDRLGLVRDGELLTAFFPHNAKAMVFRVMSRYNSGFETFDYGKLPVDAGDSLRTYDGSSETVAVNGYFPARSYATGQKFADATGDAYDTTDLWYVPYFYNDRIFHVKTFLRPAFLRIGIQVPLGVNQSRFQKDKIVTGVDTTTGRGYNLGELETVHFPEIHYGYNFGNDTNVAVRATARFVYGEYLVKIPSNPEYIFNVLTKVIPSHWVSMPMSTPDSTVSNGLRKAWGFEGFTVYPALQREKAVGEYSTIINSRDVQSKEVLI